MNVNVDEGYLLLLTPAFRGNYGESSPFVYAVADLFTAALVEMMREKNLLVSEDTVAWVGSEEAEGVLRSLVAAVDGGGILHGECVGELPLGAFPKLVDEKLGAGSFALWLEAFQAELYAEAEEAGRLPS